jgi:hypothetical protein
MDDSIPGHGDLSRQLSRGCLVICGMREFSGSHRNDALYQGTTLVGPHNSTKIWASAPAGEPGICILSPQTGPGCPISRSFFARCGIPRSSTARLQRMNRKLRASRGLKVTEVGLWYPTSREKRARYGAPRACLRGQNANSWFSHRRRSRDPNRMFRITSAHHGRLSTTT